MGLLGPGAVAPKVIPGSPSSPVKSPGGDGGDERSVGIRFGTCFFFNACGKQSIIIRAHVSV